MSGVLRLALACYSLAPLQRWVNGAALGLLAAGVVAGLTADDVWEGRNMFAFVMVGAILLVFIPTFAGGVALRFASTRSVLYLRPHGRARMLLAATLAITLTAALATLPFLAAQWFAATHGRIPGRFAAPLDVFMISWTLLVLWWVCMFALSRSVAMMGFIGLVPIVIVNAGKALVPYLPEPGWILLGGVVLWAMFARWYLQSVSVKRPEFPLSGDPAAGAEATPIGRLFSSVLSPRGRLSTPEALRMYLFGSASPLFFVLTGAWVALIFLVVQFMTAGGFRRAEPLVGMLPFLGFFNISLGFATARRARLLWLRTDLDRAGLFRLAERWGQFAAMTTWLVAAAAIVVPILLFQERSASAVVLYVFMQGVAAVALYYGGMAMIRGWSFPDVLLCILLVLLVIAQSAYFLPMRDPSMGSLAILLLAAGVVLLLLRGYAASCWHKLDWRVARMPRTGARSC